MQKLNTQVQKTLADLEFEIAQTRKGTDYKIYDITECEAFWELWKADKESLKALGYVVFKKDKYSAEYYLRDMSKMDYDCSKKASKARSLKNFEKAREVKAANDEARKALAQKSKPNAKTIRKVAQKNKKSNDITKGLNITELAQLAQALKTLNDLGFDVTQVQM